MKRSNMWAAALFLAALALWCVGVFTAQRVGDMACSVSARFSEGISPAQISTQEEYARKDGWKNMPEITIWKETPARALSDGGDRTAVASVVELYGHCEDIRFGELLAGGFPARGDSDSCAISEKTAFDLWGSHDVLGKAISSGGNIYYVRGVFWGNDGIMMVQRDSGSAEPLPNMQLRFPEKGSRDEAEAFLLKAGFTGAQLLDLPLLGWFLEAVAQLPAVTLGINVLIRLIRRGLRLRPYPFLLLKYIMPAGIAVAACLYLMGFPWNSPHRLIPTKWADFEFWERLFRQFAGNIRAWLSAAPTGRDMGFWFMALITVFVAIGTVTLLVAVMGRISIKTGWSLMAVCLCSMGTMLLVAAFLEPYGGVQINYGMWLLPWLWLGVDFALRLHENNLNPRTDKEVTYGAQNQNALQWQIDVSEKEERIVTR